MTDRPRTTIAEGLAFPGCPRWRGDDLWFCDRHAGTVLRLDSDGEVHTAARIPGGAAGLGWLPDGSMVVGSALDRTLLRVTDAAVEPIVHLRDLGRFPLNDLVVTPEGRIYVTDWGFDPAQGGSPNPTSMLCVEEVEGGWDAWPVATDLLVPDGLAVAPTGALVLAEAGAHRLTGFQIRSDGSLAAARVWADVQPNIPAGLTFDGSGAAWVCDPINDGVMRVEHNAGALDWVPTEAGHDAYACCLGGPDGDVLFLCTATTSDPARTVAEASGRIEVVTVPVPAPGHVRPAPAE